MVKARQRCDRIGGQHGHLAYEVSGGACPAVARMPRGAVIGWSPCIFFFYYPLIVVIKFV